MDSQQQQMLRANLEKLTEDLQKPIITLSEEFKTLSKQVDDIAHGLVALSSQQDILKEWIEFIQNEVKKEQDENQNQKS